MTNGRPFVFLLLLSSVFPWFQVSSFSPTITKTTTARLAGIGENSEAVPAAEAQPEAFPVELSHEGSTCEISVFAGETILAALERTGVADILAIPSVPSDCRRGSCLTCTGRHRKGSATHSVFKKEDGLAPSQSKLVKSNGFVLTCSSFVTGNGVKLELGANSNAWDRIFREEVVDAAELLGSETAARRLRLEAEQDVERWAEETEAALGRSGE